MSIRDCSLAIPSGHVAALVGPNGSGKTTLLSLAAGLSKPSVGRVTVLGGRPPGSPWRWTESRSLPRTHRYKNLSVADMLHLTRNLNRRFDQASAQARLTELGIPLKRKAGKLSGGQQAQLRRRWRWPGGPRLLVLDEPMATLDPLARHDFMATVMTAMADDGVRSCSFSRAGRTRAGGRLPRCVVAGTVQVAGEVDDLIAGHRLLTGPAIEAEKYSERLSVVTRCVADPWFIYSSGRAGRRPGTARLGGATGRPGGTHSGLPSASPTLRHCPVPSPADPPNFRM